MVRGTSDATLLSGKFSLIGRLSADATAALWGYKRLRGVTRGVRAMGVVIIRGRRTPLAIPSRCDFMSLRCGTTRNPGY